MKTRIISLFYFLSAALFLFLEDKGSFIPLLAAKAIIIPLLIILFLINNWKDKHPTDRYLLGGLAFSWAGDVVLEFSQNNGNMFILGLGCFLIAHLMYLAVFYLTTGTSVIFKKRIGLLIPVLLYGAGLLKYLYNDLADIRLPVIIYSVVILTMLSAAINRFAKVNSGSFRLVLTGAILFVLSDSLIAINKFSCHFNYSSIAIMSTYVIAQFLIVTGYIRQFRTYYN